jgi:putative FmdB family regulatory protein
MPTYEYRCQDCGNTVEVVQSFSDAPLTVCQVCGGRLRRVFHPVGIVLKGSGFYSTDNRPGKRPAATAKPKDGSSSSSTDTSSSSSPSKTETPASPPPKSDGGGKKAS